MKRGIESLSGLGSQARAHLLIKSCLTEQRQLELPGDVCHFFMTPFLCFSHLKSTFSPADISKFKTWELQSPLHVCMWVLCLSREMKGAAVLGNLKVLLRFFCLHRLEQGFCRVLLYFSLGGDSSGLRLPCSSSALSSGCIGTSPSPFLRPSSLAGFRPRVECVFGDTDCLITEQNTGSVLAGMNYKGY